MRDSRLASAPLALSLCLTAAACGAPAGAAGEAVRPEAGTGAEALGEDVAVEACPKPGYAEPLAVDFTSSQRGDLEIAMKEGVAVVRYDCKSIVLLKACRATGEYKFTGVSTKEDVVQLTSRDEIAANLPASGLKIASGVERDASLDLALVMIGKSRTLVTGVPKSALEGECEDATHTVRGAYVGAFAMSTGTRGRAKALAEVFGASAGGDSSSTKKTQARDGDLAACRSADPAAPAPPGKCRAVLRVELVPIGTEQKIEPGQKRPPRIQCADGFGASAEGDKCVAVATAEKACVFKGGDGDLGKCGKLCEGGDANACLGYAIQLWDSERFYQGDGERSEDDLMGSVRDVTAHAATLEKACASSNGAACFTLGDAANTAAQHDSKLKAAEKTDLGERAVKFYAQACDAGHEEGCLSASLYAGPNAKDYAAGYRYAVRACDLGASKGCRYASTYLKEGKHVKKDAALQKEFERRAAVAETP